MYVCMYERMYSFTNVSNQLITNVCVYAQMYVQYVSRRLSCGPVVRQSIVGEVRTVQVVLVLLLVSVAALSLNQFRFTAKQELPRAELKIQTRTHWPPTTQLTTYTLSVTHAKFFDEIFRGHRFLPLCMIPCSHAVFFAINRFAPERPLFSDRG